jgi:hypothetical protein
MIKSYYDLISSLALKRALQMKLCIFILSSLVLITLTGIRENLKGLPCGH